MKTQLLFLILIFFCTIGFGQTQNTDKKNSVEFSTGYNSGSLKNLAFAPVSRYDYNGLVYKLNYERTSKNQNLFEVQLDYLYSELKTEAIPILNAEYSKMGLGFSYLKQLLNKNAFSVHAGLQSQTTVSSYRNWASYDAKQSLGITGRLTYQLNKKQAVSSKLTIPLVLLRVSSFDSNILSLNRYQSILFNIDYKYSLSNNFDAIVSYDFNYERLQVPIAFREVQYQLNLGLNFKF